MLSMADVIETLEVDCLQHTIILAVAFLKHFTFEY